VAAISLDGGRVTEVIGRLCCVGLMVQFTAASSCAGAPGDNEFRSYGPFTVRSHGDGQMSTDQYSINVRTAGKLALSYTAPRLHCASLRMHFSVDGVEKAVSPTVAPGQRTGYIELGPVSPGSHVVALQAEGIVGGCNVGRLTAWEGSAEAWTTLIPGDHSNLRSNDLGPLVLEVAHESHGDSFQSDGTYVTDDGSVHRYQFEQGSAPWSPEPHADGTYPEAGLLEKYGHRSELLGRVTAADFGDIKRAAFSLRALDGTPHDMSESPAASVSGNRARSTDQTIMRVYRRTQANGDYEVALIAQTGDEVWFNNTNDGIRLRAWLEGLSKPGAYEPVPHVVCVKAPCPQPASTGAGQLRK